MWLLFGIRWIVVLVSWTKVNCWSLFYFYYYFYCWYFVNVSGSMDRVHHIAKWVCVFCFVEKSSVVYDWTVFRCNHLVCLTCFRSRVEELKRMFACPCGAQFPKSAYD